MSTHNICFPGEIRKILCGYPLLSVAMTCVIYNAFFFFFFFQPGPPSQGAMYYPPPKTQMVRFISFLSHITTCIVGSSFKMQGPDVQSILRLTSWLVVKMLTVLVSTVQYLIHRYLEKLLQMPKQLTFFLANILVYFPHLMIKVLMIHVN